jgi:eukaryotic-like serine/threonine-protein kinase
MKIKPGDLIDSRYRIVDVLGEGGHGRVYRAEDIELSSQVALKFLHSEIAAEPGFKTRMQREARAMGQLSGTSAVQILGFNRAENVGMYLVMEYLEGKDLGRHLGAIESGGGRMAVAEMIDILGPIVETLEAAHERGIVHRDLKPANIFLLDSSSRGRVRLLDFGLVKDLKADRLTQTGTVAGSPSYIAPEMWRGKPDLVDHRVDVYSLGVIIYRILASRMPFDPKQPIDKLLVEVTRGPRPSLHAIRPDLPVEIDQWVEKALAIAPSDRFQSVFTEWSVLKVVLAADS